MAGRWLDVQSAAQELGISTDAVRKRIARGTLPSEERDGRRVVWLDTGGTEAGPEPTDSVSVDRELVDHLRSEVEYLREENRRKDHIIAGLVQRVPELPERVEDATQQAPEGDPVPSEPEPTEGRERGSQRGSWWSRLLGRG